MSIDEELMLLILGLGDVLLVLREFWGFNGRLISSFALNKASIAPVPTEFLLLLPEFDSL